MSSYQEQHSDTSPAETGRQEAYEPTPEDYRGEVLPGGRGIELHGVEWVPDREDDGKGDLKRIEYEEPVREIEPIPVQIVQEHGREERHWRVGRAVLSQGQQSAILGRAESRILVRLTLVAGAAYIGDDQNNATSFGGYPLAIGVPVEIPAIQPVYAFTNDVAGADIAILQVYSVER